MNEILINVISVIVTVVVIHLITWCGAELVNFLQAKTKSTNAADYLSGATTIVTNAVKTVTQTYVDELKKNGSFSIDAQRDALKQASELAKRQLNEEVKTFISSNYGDLDAWLATQIESTINTLKNNPHS